MQARLLAVVLFGLVFGVVPAVNAADSDTPTFPSIDKEQAERLRQAGEQACQQMLGTAMVLGETLGEIGQQMSRQMAQAGEQLARQMAPTMRELAERLDELARQMEQRPPERERK